MSHSTLSCSLCPLDSHCGFQIQKVARGQTLLHQGAPITQFFQIRSGCLSASKLSRSGAEILFSLRGRGHCLGFEGLNGGLSLFEVRAHEDCELCVAPMELIQTQLQKHNHTARFVVNRLLQELQEQQREHLLRSLPARERICTFLLDCMDREPCHLLSGSTISRLLGIRPETLSRTLTQLRKQGLISPSPEIMVLQPKQLADLLG